MVTKVEKLEGQIIEQKSQIETLEEQIRGSSETISNLSKDILGHTQSIEKLTESNLVYQTGIEEKDANIKKLEDEVFHFKNLIESKQEEINSLEIKKMARAFENQEDSYRTSMIGWLCAVILVWGTFIEGHIVLISEHLNWMDHIIQGGTLTLLGIGVLWFVSSQYGYYSRLRNDYANRKVIAQSYHNILLSMSDENLTDEEKIINKATKTEFINKSLSVLCAGNIQDDKDVFFTKHSIKSIAELLKQVNSLKSLGE
ncbi:MAG: hypothetical protein PHQ95_02720 [Candidatus Gracilibacteria bacterium]|nr:hypothetical protein [Candidatus Gracilibacteria bacterium]